MRRRGAATQRSFAHAHDPRAPHSLVAAARHSVPPITHKPNSSRRRDQRLRERARAGAQAHSGPDAGEREQCLDIMKRAGAVAEGEGRGGGGGGLAKAVFRKVWRNEVRPFDKHRNMATRSQRCATLLAGCGKRVFGPFSTDAIMHYDVFNQSMNTEYWGLALV